MQIKAKMVHEHKPQTTHPNKMHHNLNLQKSHHFPHYSLASSRFELQHIVTNIICDLLPVNPKTKNEG